MVRRWKGAGGEGGERVGGRDHGVAAAAADAAAAAPSPARRVGARSRRLRRGWALVLAASASLWAAGDGHPRDGGCPSAIHYDAWGPQPTVLVRSGPNTLSLQAMPVSPDGRENELNHVEDRSRPDGDIMLGGGRRVATVAAAVLTWEAGTTYAIITDAPTEPSLLCLYELEADSDMTGTLRAATGDLDRDGPSLLYRYLQWTPSGSSMQQLVVLVFAIHPGVGAGNRQMPATEFKLIVHTLWQPDDGAAQPIAGLPTRNGCTCLPRTISNEGNLLPACETRGQWCDVVPGCQDSFRGKVGGNYAGWDYCETANPDQTICRYDDDNFCDAGTPVCPATSLDFDDCHCPYQGDGMCDEGQMCYPGSDSLDCCPSTGDGVCDEGRRCPALSDRADCFCATKWNSNCEEDLEGGGSSCAFLADQADCANEAQRHPVCPTQYEGDGKCDAGGLCPCGTDSEDCSGSGASVLESVCDAVPPPRPCSTSAACYNPAQRQYCAWYSDYSYTTHCRACEDGERTCSDFSDAVEGSCDYCNAEVVQHGCAENEVQVELTLHAASGNGWDGRIYRLEALHSYDTFDNVATTALGSPESNRDKSVFTFTRSVCIALAPCYRLDVSLSASMEVQAQRVPNSTIPPAEHGSQLTWRLDRGVGHINADDRASFSASGGYGSFMIPGHAQGAGHTPQDDLADQAVQDYCENIISPLCGSGVHVVVEVSPSTLLGPDRRFDPRLGQRWTLVEEFPLNDHGIAYDFPVCEERQLFGAQACAAVPSSGKLQYSLCLQPSTRWFRFTYFVSPSEDVGESGISVMLNGDHVHNATTFTSLRLALGDKTDITESWTSRPPIVDDSQSRGDRTCWCSSGNCIVDCSGRCASSTHVGDGVCNDRFNCKWLQHDDGDCYEHWVIQVGTQFNGHHGDWLAFSKHGHKQLAMVAALSEGVEDEDSTGVEIGGIFSSDGTKRFNLDSTQSGSNRRPGHACLPDHQIGLGNMSSWTVCETTEAGLAFLHGHSERRDLKMLATVAGRIWVSGAGAGQLGGFVEEQPAIGSNPASTSLTSCSSGLQPLLSVGDWKLCESGDMLCGYHHEAGRDILKFSVTGGMDTGDSRYAAVWTSDGEQGGRGHFLATRRRTTPETFEPAGGFITNGVWRTHSRVNGSSTEYALWVNGQQLLQKSYGDSVAEFTSDCFNSGIIIAISAITCSRPECSRQAALRFSTVWCNERIGTNADDWKCSTQAEAGWQYSGFVEGSAWESPRSKSEQAGQAANTSRFTGDGQTEWIWAMDRGDHPYSVWCRYVRQPGANLPGDGGQTDQQYINEKPNAGGDNQGDTEGKPQRNSQVSGYVFLGALLAASVAGLTRKFFNQSWQQKLDGELHLGMVMGYEESQFDYSTDNPMTGATAGGSRREDVDVAVRQSILNRFGDDHEAIASIIDTGGLDNLAIDAVIGRGARSVVYAAEYMGCRVALKQLQLVDQAKRNSNDPEGGRVDGNGSTQGNLGAGTRSADQESAVQQVLKEFAAEVRILSKLQHPNVIRYVGFTTNPHCLIIQEFAPNGDLRSYLEAKKQHHQAAPAEDWEWASQSNGPLTLLQQVTMALDIARGMEYLHGRTPSVLHRDLKSPNLLVDENLRIKITDFGLAREKDTTIEGKTGLMTVCGTPLWTAPEILKGQLYNEAADVYSFSLCLWEVWAMTVPFHELGLGPMEVLLQVVNDDRRPTMPDEIPPLFADLVVRCWATDAAERPNFVAIVAELETFAELSGFGTIAAPKSFDPPNTVSGDLASIGSVNSLASSGGAGSSGSSMVASSSVFSLETRPTSAGRVEQGSLTAL